MCSNPISAAASACHSSYHMLSKRTYKARKGPEEALKMDQDTGRAAK